MELRRCYQHRPLLRDRSMESVERRIAASASIVTRQWLRAIARAAPTHNCPNVPLSQRATPACNSERRGAGFNSFNTCRADGRFSLAGQTESTGSNRRDCRTWASRSARHRRQSLRIRSSASNACIPSISRRPTRGRVASSVSLPSDGALGRQAPRPAGERAPLVPPANRG
jgi:hypothetical protein